MLKWIGKFIEIFRSQYALMTSDERRFIYNLDDFSAPCQVDLFWFQPPDVQYVIVTHFEDRPDLEINVNGPFPTYEGIDRLESILEESRWSHPIPKGDYEFALKNGSNVRDVIETCFVSMVKDFQRLPFLRPAEKASHGFKSSLFHRAFIWYLHGDISREDPSDVVHEIIKHAKDFSLASRTSQPAAPPEAKQVIHGHGSFMLPPVWIGVEPKPSFREKALGGRPMFPAKACDGSYKGKLVVADKDGFLAIAETDRMKATGLLNEIMAVRLLQGNSAFSFREQEVEPATIDPLTKEIGSFGVPSSSPRAYLMDERWSLPRLPVYGKRDVISIEQFQELLRQAEGIARDPETADALRFLLEAYTHFQDSRYLESFVLSWLVVEKHLYAKWREFLKGGGVPRPRRDKLLNPGNWSIDYVIEGLTLVGQVPQKDYAELMQMKSLRNDIIHEGERVSKEQADQAFGAAAKIVSERAGIPQPKSQDD